MMILENAAALRILMNDDLFLTQADRQQNETVEVLMESEIETPENTVVPEVLFQGKNLQHFLILTETTLPENHLSALENTLSRKQLSLDDVALVDSSAHKRLNFDQLYASFMPQKLVLFGLDPSNINLPEVQLNQVLAVSDCQILYTYSFQEMLGNKEKTKAFWEQMKNL